MSDQQTDLLTITMAVKLRPADMLTAEPIDIALVKQVGGEVISDLEQEGYIVKPAEKYLKGADVVAVIITQVVTITHEVLQQADGLSHSLDELGTLAGIFGAIVQAVNFIKDRVSKKKSRSNEKPKKLFSLRIEIDGASLFLESEKLPDRVSTQQLLQQFLQLHPEKASQVNEQSQIIIEAQLPNNELDTSPPEAPSQKQE